MDYRNELFAFMAFVYVTMMAWIYIESDFYPWPFDPPSIHKVKLPRGG